MSASYLFHSCLPQYLRRDPPWCRVWVSDRCRLKIPTILPLSQLCPRFFVWFPFIAPTGAPSASPTGTIQLIGSNFPAFQSSANNDFATADKAIDGNTNGDYLGQSVMHTLDQCDPWWYVNLNDVPNGWGGPVVVKSVTVWNRSDCCWDRLYGALVDLMDGSGTILASRIITSAIGAGAQSLSYGAVAGVTRIRIRILDCNKILQLAEVRAFGYVP
jgi:hypothetical protein